VKQYIPLSCHIIIPLSFTHVISSSIGLRDLVNDITLFDQCYVSSKQAQNDDTKLSSIS